MYDCWMGNMGNAKIFCALLDLLKVENLHFVSRIAPFTSFLEEKI